LQRATLKALCAAALLSSAPAHSQSKVEVREVAPGVYAATQPAAQRFDDSNAAIILLDDGVLVVDWPALRKITQFEANSPNQAHRWAIQPTCYFVSTSRWASKRVGLESPVALQLPQ
jgi:hypothetical protein